MYTFLTKKKKKSNVWEEKRGLMFLLSSTSGDDGIRAER